MPVQILGGEKRCIMGFVQVENLSSLVAIVYNNLLKQLCFLLYFDTLKFQSQFSWKRAQNFIF